MALERELQLLEANSSTSKFHLELASGIGKTGLEEGPLREKIEKAGLGPGGETAVGQACK